jgi:hypothetical protein
MDKSDNPGALPAAFIKAQQSLAPYIKSRQEASRIRGVLAAHLEAQIEHTAGHPTLALPSLPNCSSNVKPFSKTVHGLQKEYLKALKANIKARREYDQVSAVDCLRQPASANHHTAAAGLISTSTGTPDREEYLATYVSLTRQRQRHERLRILQNYVDKLEQKAEAATSFLDQAKSDVSQLQRIPAELVTSSDATPQDSSQGALQDLIRQLERAVLRAKLQLRSEKQLLEKVKADQSRRQQTNGSVASESQYNLQPLGRTRNELIKWIEEELSKAGDSAPDEGSLQGSPCDEKVVKPIDEQLDAVKAQYHQYIQARTEFLDSIAEPVNPELFPKAIYERPPEEESPEKEHTTCATWIISPYLQDLLSTANEQKSLIQQKSHLTVSLSKQHKETVLSFDRLAHESNLLPMFPLSAQNASRRGYGQLEMNELEGKEMPNTSHRARAWTHAADLAGAATKDAILANTEEVEVALDEARQLLASIEQLVGQNKSNRLDDLTEEKGKQDEDIWTSGIASKNRHAKAQSQSKRATLTSRDIWSTLDGNLGVLKMPDAK